MYQFNPTQKMSAAGLQSYTVRWRLITNYGKIKMLVSLKCVVANAMWRALKSAIFVETRLVFLFCHFALPCHSIFSSLYDITATTTSKKESERRHRERADNNSAQRIIFGTLGLFAKKKTPSLTAIHIFKQVTYVPRNFLRAFFQLILKPRSAFNLPAAPKFVARFAIAATRVFSPWPTSNLIEYRAVHHCPSQE